MNLPWARQRVRESLSQSSLFGRVSLAEAAAMIPRRLLEVWCEPARGSEPAVAAPNPLTLELRCGAELASPDAS
jgi:hypothetical protein